LLGSCGVNTVITSSSLLANVTHVTIEELLEPMFSIKSMLKLCNEPAVYGDLALQVGGVSDETVKYGREFFETSI
jgi:hypothetical protein